MLCLQAPMKYQKELFLWLLTISTNKPLISNSYNCEDVFFSLCFEDKQENKQENRRKLALPNVRDK